MKDMNLECRLALQKLAREQMKTRLLADIAMDIQICSVEGIDYMQYLKDLKSIIDSFFPPHYDQY